MRLKRLLIYLSDFLWLKVLGGNSIKKQYSNRCKAITSIALGCVSSDEPYVLDGRWSWFSINNTVYPISILFPEQPLAIQVFGPEIGPWRECRPYCKNKESWDKANEVSKLLQYLCKSANIPIVCIYWDEAIDQLSIESRIKPLLKPDIGV